MRTCSLFGSVRKRSVRLTRVLTCSALAAGLYSNNVHAGSFCNGLTQPWRSIPSSPSSTRRQAGRLSQDLLVMQNFCSTNSIIEYFKSESRLMKLAKLEQDALEARDRKDAQFLADGVQQAIEEGLLAQLEETPAYEDIDVMSMTPNQCAEFIASKLPRDGAVVVVVGGSGTGKQTTVNELMKLLPSAVAWSNGDCFRSLTMLAIAHSKQSGERITDCLTSQNLDTWAGMLEVTTEGDVLIKGCGIDEKVSEIKNTLLKDPGLEELLPKVASLSQATVLGFARRASEKLCQSGQTALLEGRQETLDHIPTEHRFRLTMPEEGRRLLGERRLAQRILARYVRKPSRKDADVELLLRECLKEESDARL